MDMIYDKIMLSHCVKNRTETDLTEIRDKPIRSRIDFGAINIDTIYENAMQRCVLNHDTYTQYIYVCIYFFCHLKTPYFHATMILKTL